MEYDILVVDDDRYALAGMSKNLEKEGHRVVTAVNGEAAVDRIKDKNFDLVLTDLIMDEINGLDVLKTVKVRNPDSVVVVLTGYGDMESAIDALRFGADDYLLKSAELEEISFRINRCFEKLELNRKIKLYEEVLPVCCICKKIRDNSGERTAEGSWMSVEEFIYKKSGRHMSHTYCPTCLKESTRENMLR